MLLLMMQARHMACCIRNLISDVIQIEDYFVLYFFISSHLCFLLLSPPLFFC